MPHEAALRAWLRNRKLPGLEIDDIIQETYSKLIALDSVAHIRNPRTYAFQTAHSVLVSQARRARVVSFELVADIDELAAIADDPSPERQIADRDELRRLGEAIAGLPGKIRDVFTLRRIEGLSQREVATRLGLSESTVEKHMSRSLLLLADRFVRGGNPSDRASEPVRPMRGSHAQGDRSGD
ncbi:RNA polymerase sigma factor [Brevundimonas staleyi]|uniref:RNA polymerase sigma factor n=1 Tax=Brevundimonas staleyi TaxID=74326 RepID=UPI0035A5E173